MLAGWKNPEYRWYYIGTTVPLAVGVFQVTNSPDLVMLTLLGMTALWFLVDLAT